MRDYDIIEWLSSIDPVNQYQREKLIKAIEIFKVKSLPESLELYFNTIGFDDVNGGNVNQLYNNYVAMCNESMIRAESKINFSRHVCKYFNVYTKTEDKERVYMW